MAEYELGPIHIEAIVLCPSKSGGSRAIPDGARALFDFGGELVACEIASLTGEGIPRDTEQLIQVTLHRTTRAHASLGPGSAFELTTGDRLLGSGVVETLERSNVEP